MKVVAIWVSILIFVSVAFSVPITEDEQRPEYMEFDSRKPEYYRGQRFSENYNAVPPCAAAAAASAGTARSFSPDMVHRNDFAPKFAPSSYDYAYTGNMYRAEEPYGDNREMLGFSDTNFLNQPGPPMGRSAYGVAPSYLPISGANIANLNGQLLHQVPSGYGLLPNTNLGNCGVPLFFSCTPSIVPGRLVKSELHGYNNNYLVNAHPDAYRGVNYMHTNQGNNAEKMIQDHDHISTVKSDTVTIKDKLK